jgi:hypothetical protein
MFVTASYFHPSYIFAGKDICRYNDTQHNNIQHNETQHNNTLYISHYAVSFLLSVATNPNMLSVVLFSVVMLNVVAPAKHVEWSPVRNFAKVSFSLACKY